MGRYYPNDSWAGPPALVRIDPVISFYFHRTPLPRPYTAEWTGWVLVPQDGVYTFGTENISASWLEIDGQLVLANEEHNVYRETQLELARGAHRIKLRFLDDAGYSHIYLYWKPPGAAEPSAPPLSPRSN
nr:hypothetical protein [Anaerolineae bacterium]